MEGIQPISPELDEDLMAMRIGKELGVPAVDVMFLPAHWIGSATVALEWQRVEAEKHSKRHRKGAASHKPAANPRQKRS